MRCTRRWRSIWLGLFVFGPVGGAWAEGEFWLNYRFSDRPDTEICQEYRSYGHRAQTSQPAGLELPKDAGKDPVFVRWPTKMDRSGGRWFALVRSPSTGKYSRLYVDRNGDQKLSDEKPQEAKLLEDRGPEYCVVDFGAVELTFEGEDGPITYHIKPRVHVSRNAINYVSFSSACCYEGEVTLDGRRWRVMLVDVNTNGRFDDANTAANPGNCDQIGIEAVKGEAALLVRKPDFHYVAKLIRIGSTYYKPEPAPDGAFIRLTKIERVPVGRVRTNPALRQIRVGGENGGFVEPVTNGIFSLPCGSYWVEEWMIERNDKGTTWKMRGRYPPTTFAVTADNVTDLPLAEPLRASLTAELRDGNWYFDHALTGRGGERIEFYRDGQRAPAPKVRIENADKTYSQLFSLEYG